MTATVIVVAGAVATFAYATYLLLHVDALVFTASTEYEGSSVVRWLGTWGLLLSAPVWTAITWALRRGPHWPARWLGRVAWVMLPIAALFNAAPFVTG